jgi:hypothetical protein
LILEFICSRSEVAASDLMYNSLVKKYITKRYIRFRDKSIVTGALVVVCLFNLQIIFGQPPSRIEFLQKIVLLAFAIAIPGLSFLYYATKYSNEFKIPDKPALQMAVAILFLSGMIGPIVGFGLIIWRYYPPAGYAFFLVSIVALLTFLSKE